MGISGRLARNRTAYTLIEMLIVLAVFASLAAMIWPAARRMLGRSELREAAKQVRTALVRARLDAIETGVPHRFRYQVGTGRYEVAPLPVALDDEETPSAPTGASWQRDDEATEQTIPAGVWFAEPGAVREGPDMSAASPLPGDAGWSASTIFYPNGRSSDARVCIASSSGTFVEVRLRGLNGSTRIGPVQRPEERP